MRLRLITCTLLVVTVLVTVLVPVVGRAQEGAPSDSAAADSAVYEPKVSFLPVLGSAPETGFQYGAVVFATKEHRVAGTRTSSAVANAIRTAKGQTRAFVAVDGWTADNDWRVAGVVVWQQFPLAFFGIGDATEESAKETYTPRGTDFGMSVQRRIGAQTWIVGSVQRTESEMLSTEAGGLLASGTIVGSRGGRIVLTGAGIITDTRDLPFATTSGHYAELSLAFSDPAVGSEFSFSRLKVDARSYRRFGRRGHVAAVQATAQGITGAAPFDQLSLIGSSSSMRGYFPGRFRDNWMAAAQAEVRSALVRNWGLALFSGGGVVAADFGDLASARLLPTIGGGVRYRMDPRSGATIRVDYARGTKGQSGLYVSFGEAF